MSFPRVAVIFRYFKQPTAGSAWPVLTSLFPLEVIYGAIPVKTTKRQSNLIKGTFIWVQVSVGTEYQVILCINREGLGESYGCSL